MIIDEWKIFMLNNAIIFQFIDAMIATKTYSRIWNIKNINDDFQIHT
jgi:hypothetical protein